jgi:clan AA aspartic protease
VATFDGVVVDTGFNGWLTLSQVEVRALDLELREEGRYWLADGSEMVSRLYTAEVEWVGEWRRIMVLEMAGGSLLGMALLRGFHLGIDVESGGTVEVDLFDDVPENQEPRTRVRGLWERNGRLVRAAWTANVRRRRRRASRR